MFPIKTLLLFSYHYLPYTLSLNQFIGDFWPQITAIRIRRAGLVVGNLLRLKETIY